MLQQDEQTIGQQEPESDQDPSLPPHWQWEQQRHPSHPSPEFKPPQGSLRRVNMRVWEHVRGNRKIYWETVYEAILKLQGQYGDLVTTLPWRDHKPNLLCRICNHPDLDKSTREKNKSKPQPYSDLAPHIITHASSPIKPWFSVWCDISLLIFVIPNDST
jgi:hypothetical protein